MLDKVRCEANIGAEELVEGIRVNVWIGPNIPRAVLNLEVVNDACEVGFFRISKLN